MHNDLKFYIQGHLAINLKSKLLKYGLSYCVPFIIAHTVLDGFFQYFTKMITCIEGRVMGNDF